MEPIQTHGAILPQQELTQPAEGCPSGPRPEDLLQGGHEGANPHIGTRVANDATDSAVAGAPQTPGVSASAQGGPTRLHIYECFAEESKKLRKTGSPEDLTFSQLLSITTREIGHSLKPLSTSDENRLINVISFFLTKTMKMFRACKSNNKYFRKKHQAYLEQYFLCDVPDDLKINKDEQTNTSPINEDFTDVQAINVTGSPMLLTSPNVVTYDDSNIIGKPSSTSGSKHNSLGYRQQLRSKKRLIESYQNEPPQKVIKDFVSTVAVVEKLTPTASKDLEAVIQTCLLSPSRVTKVNKKINAQTQPYTPEEALGVIIDRKFSVETYKDRQHDLKSRGFPAYPSYAHVLNARKACYPTEEIKVSDVEASVSLKGLLKHTLERIVKSCEEGFTDFCHRKGSQEVTCVFEGSWGFDGSTGQSIYKQAFSQSAQDPSFTENSLFATTFVPLRIVADKTYVAWLNPAPQSYRFCRPLHIQYQKETKEIILAEKAWVEDQIKNISDITIKTSKGQTLKFTCKLTLSVIDGKVLNIITGTSSQLRCPFCKLTCSQFNDLDACFSTPASLQTLKHGINPLHAWIRVFEFLLHLGYKNDPRVRKWRINKNTEESRIVEERKTRIQNEIRTKMGLLVDVVRPNAGTTNDGNTNRHTFGEILELESCLLDDLYTILVTISSELPIDSDKFGTFCRFVAEKYIASYSWHPMTVTIHKILVHGKEIIDSNPLPVGMLSEQAAESRNKFWRSDREHHCRKMDREKTMIDLFHRALESSDPVISMIRLDRRKRFSKRLPLPVGVRELLRAVDVRDLPKNYDESTSESECLNVQDNENTIMLSTEADLTES